MIRNASIRVKIVMLSLLCLLAAIAALTFINMRVSTEVSETTSTASQQVITKAIEKNLLTTASEKAAKIKALFSNSIASLESLADQFATFDTMIRYYNVSPDIIRDNANQALRQAFVRAPDLLGVWAAMNPDQLGDDAPFVNDLAHGSNEKGRFSNYWNRPHGKEENSATSDADLSNSTPSANGLAYNAFFTCPQATKSTCVTEPFVGSTADNPILMTTVSVPVLTGDYVAGVVGVDITLNSLQQLAVTTKNSLYDGAADVMILSSTGIVAANTRQPETVGKLITSQTADQRVLQGMLEKGVSQISRLNDAIRVTYPVQTSEGGKPWWIVLDLPESVIGADANKLSALVQSLQRNAITTTITVALAIIIIGSMLMWFMASTVTKPINTVAGMLKEIASGEGDLTQRLKYSQEDELGNLVSWFNRFLDKLQPTIQKIKLSINDTRDTANQSLLIAQQTSHGMQTQFRDIDQVATASNEMSATAHDVASNAAQAADAARKAEESAVNGRASIVRSTEEIQELSEKVTQAMLQVQDLAKNSAEIGEVLDVIRGVAQQTNLLALNAAIEAARAGESGRGFAVVADEVRSLAMRTQQSVEQIRVVIESLQKGTQAAAQTMDVSHDSAVKTTQQIQETVNAFAQITDAVSVISEMNLQIATAAEEQSAVAEEVSRNISNIRAVTEELNSRAGEAAGMSQELNALADSQYRLAEQFKTH